MKYCHTFTKLSLLICALALITSCGKDKVDPEPDLSINSSDNFEIISKYGNGWIKEAVKKNPSGTTKSAFEYHENGYIKRANIYRSVPQHYLFSTLERDEINQPLSSKYYYPNGDTFLSIVYENGQPSSKTLYSENGNTTISQYQNGRISTIEKEDAVSGQITKVEYSYSDQKRTLTIKSGDNVLHNEELSLSEDLGSGLNTNEDLALSRFIPYQTPNEINISSAQSSSFSWKRTIDPFDSFIPAPVVYDKWLQPKTAAIDVKFIANGNIYRSIAEQYPFVEKRALLLGFLAVDKKYTLSPEIATKEDIGKQLRDNLEQFTNLYGDEFNHEKFSGKYFLAVATLRNMPTDTKVSEQIEEIARKHALWLVTGESFYNITDTEKELLSSVFFELKVHSSLLNNVNGIVISSYEDYEEAVETVNNAPSDIIQWGFKKYSAVAINN